MLKNRQKKKFYKRECKLIDEKIWRQGLRIITVETIREGVRMEYDRINGAIKGQEEALKRLLKQHNIPEKSLKALEVDIKKVETQTRDQWIETMHQHRKTSWNKEIDNLCYLCQNDKKAKETLRKAGQDILEAYETIQKFKRDAENMREQMVGKFSEKEQAHVGGIDQEIREVENNIMGGEEFKRLIMKERKKL